MDIIHLKHDRETVVIGRLDHVLFKALIIVRKKSFCSVMHDFHHPPVPISSTESPYIVYNINIFGTIQLFKSQQQNNEESFVSLAITVNFLESSFRLDKKAKKYTMDAISQLENNPDNYALRCHRIDKMKCDPIFVKIIYI